MTTEQNIYEFKKKKKWCEAATKEEDIFIRDAMCMPARVISLQLQNQKYTNQQPENFPGPDIWCALCGPEIFRAKQWGELTAMLQFPA